MDAAQQRLTPLGDLRPNMKSVACQFIVLDKCTLPRPCRNVAVRACADPPCPLQLRSRQRHETVTLFTSLLWRTRRRRSRYLSGMISASW